MITDQELELPSGDTLAHIHPSGWKPVREYARAVIEANNAKVLADLKPACFYDGTNFVWRKQVLDAKPLYSADKVSALIQRNEALEAKYSELIMCVGNKYPNESRHETAKRYLNNAECEDRLREPVAQTLKATP